MSGKKNGSDRPRARWRDKADSRQSDIVPGEGSGGLGGGFAGGGSVGGGENSRAAAPGDWHRPRASAYVCQCGARMESQGLKLKRVLTILGPVSYGRSMFQCPVCQSTRYPGDEELDIVGTTRSPGLRRMMARAGSRSTFKEGREDLKIYAGIEVSAKDVERGAEGVGQQMEAWAAQERKEVLQTRNGYGQKRRFPFSMSAMMGPGCR